MVHIWPYKIIERRKNCYIRTHVFTVHWSKGKIDVRRPRKLSFISGLTVFDLTFL